MSKIKKYKVIDEYKNFYLTEDKKGFKECFKKGLYHPNNGFIEVEITDYNSEEKEKNKLPKEKINRNFNPTNFLKKENKK